MTRDNIPILVCDGDEGFCGGVQRVSAARKPWRCSMCAGRVEVGQPYVRIRRIGRPVVVTHAPGQCRATGSTAQDHENGSL